MPNHFSPPQSCSQAWCFLPNLFLSSPLSDHSPAQIPRSGVRLWRWHPLQSQCCIHQVSVHTVKASLPLVVPCHPLKQPLLPPLCHTLSNQSLTFQPRGGPAWPVCSSSFPKPWYFGACGHSIQHLWSQFWWPWTLPARWALLQVLENTRIWWPCSSRMWISTQTSIWC